ncbi:MAG: hypothetical protein M2R45_00190 [Verrucomicrobia subdivision 3 bacterium]|nr:hypothetical protein [Limisphaerales bacterium]MCS1412351.1 hypothetical protein [Limisphaerales bacterium]
MPWLGNEPTLPSVAKELVCLSVLQDTAVTMKRESADEVRAGDRAAIVGNQFIHPIFDADIEWAVWFVPHGYVAVIDHVEVQPAVAINICQCLADWSGPIAGFVLETPVAGIEEETRSATDAIDKKIGITVIVNIGEGSVHNDMIGE